MNTRTHVRGITLVELMTTISALAITLTVGVPTLSSVQVALQRGQAAAEFLASFTLARSEAARRGIAVTVCASTTGQACDTGTSPDWRNGWIVFTDTDEDRRVDTGTDEVLRVAHFDHAQFSLRSPSAIASGVAFRGSGYPNAVGTFRYCDTRQYQDLALNYIGRIEIAATGTGCP